MFEDIKVGDLVRVNKHAMRVTHVTKTRFKTGNIEFYKKDGREYGQSSFSEYYRAFLSTDPGFDVAVVNTLLKDSKEKLCKALKVIDEAYSRSLNHGSVSNFVFFHETKETLVEEHCSFDLLPAAEQLSNSVISLCTFIDKVLK